MRKRSWVYGWFAIGALAFGCSGKYSSSDGGGVQHQAIDCGAHTACDLDTPCAYGSCIAISGCSSALCVNPTDICKEACGATDCAVADSYPGQLSSCPDGTAIEGNGASPVRRHEPSSSGGSTPASMGPGTGPITGTAGVAVSQGGSGPTAGGGHAGGTPGASGTAGIYQPIIVENIHGELAVYCPQFERCGPSTQMQCELAGTECLGISGCDPGVCVPKGAFCAQLCTGQCVVDQTGYPSKVYCGSPYIFGTEEAPTAGAGGEGGSF